MAISSAVRLFPHIILGQAQDIMNDGETAGNKTTIAIMNNISKTQSHCLLLGSTLPFANQLHSTRSKKEATSIRQDPFSDAPIITEISCIFIVIITEVQ